MIQEHGFSISDGVMRLISTPGMHKNGILDSRAMTPEQQWPLRRVLRTLGPDGL